MSDSTQMERYEPQGELSRSRYEPRDLDQLKSYAKIVVTSGLCPDHIKGPADALLIMQRGAEMGITAVNALQNMYVINGKASMSAQIAVGVCKASPLCRYFQCVEYEAERVTWETHRVGNPNPTRVTFTKDDAQRAGLWGRGMWAKYPQNMLSARASINLARMEYSDLLAGIYTPDELGSDAPPEAVQAPTGNAQPKRAAKTTDDIIDADFEESPAPATQRNRTYTYTTNTKSMRGDSASKQAAQYVAIQKDEEREREKKTWSQLNAAIHAQAKGLNDVWYRAFHDYITAAVGAPNWNALTVDQLKMVLERFKRVKDPVAWIKEAARGSVKAPNFKDSAEGVFHMDELIRDVSKSNDAKLEGLKRMIADHYDVAFPAALTVDQLQEIWCELATRSALAPNGGQGGELSEREEWISSLVAASKPVESEAFADEEIPF